MHPRLVALELAMNPMSLMTLPAGLLNQARFEQSSRSPHGERGERVYALMAAVAVVLVAAIAAFA